ncbi:hypothetical protein CK203_068914 [Vitis vinifera]|uniref:Uncharacterized protein n=1 Tax=Vitis vinifera TaxID=29760 RepID=A0A438F255_VITVI|nr:hypothetical protein CK203_068914 [Vitis vinifera]
MVNLGQPSVTTNPLPAHITHSCSTYGGIHHMDFVQDDVIHMLSWDDGLPKTIVPNDGYEIVMTRSEDNSGSPPVTRPFGGTNSCEDVRRENDEILRDSTCVKEIDIEDSTVDELQHMLPSDADG